jgi:hypothetical protein
MSLLSSERVNASGSDDERSTSAPSLIGIEPATAAPALPGAAQPSRRRIRQRPLLDDVPNFPSDDELREEALKSGIDTIMNRLDAEGAHIADRAASVMTAAGFALIVLPVAQAAGHVLYRGTFWPLVMGSAIAFVLGLAAQAVRVGTQRVAITPTLEDLTYACASLQRKTYLTLAATCSVGVTLLVFVISVLAA